MKIKNTVNFDVGFSESDEDSLVVVDEQTTKESNRVTWADSVFKTNKLGL